MLCPESPSRVNESLSELIERIICFNEENGCVGLKAKAKEQRNLVAVLDFLASIAIVGLSVVGRFDQRNLNAPVTLYLVFSAAVARVCLGRKNNI